MIRSFTRLASLCLSLLSTVCNLVVSFGCQPRPSRSRVSSSLSMAPRPNPNGVRVSNGVAGRNADLVSSSPPPSTTTSAASALAMSNGHCKSCSVVPNGFHKSNGSAKTKAYHDGGDETIALYPHPGNERLVRPKVSFSMKLSSYFTHGTLFVFGYLNDLLRHWGLLISWEKIEHGRQGYSPLFSNFATFYVRNVIQRLIDMWCHPICSVPGAVIDILERSYTPYNASWKYTGRILKTINMGSYNYLGFAENSGPRMDAVIDSIRTNGVGLCTVPNELGTFVKYRKLEQQVASFLGVEDSVIIGMGFATNSLGLPCLFGPGSLVLSDKCNHASLALGCKLSGAKVEVFKHNDMKHLESLLRASIVKGQANGKPWEKVIILVEGIYSMEGTIVNLPKVIRLKRRYKAYLYMDEAHSIGAMGPRGRGICDYYGCNPQDVDVFMGTFTKSFAAAGGYISGSKKIIDYIRAQSPSFFYANTIASPVVQQISYILDEFLQMDKNNNHLTQLYYEDYSHRTATTKQCQLNGFLKTINDSGNKNLERMNTTHDVQSRIIQLRKNARYFRHRLKEMGFHVDGHDDSPVVPIMVYSPALLKCLIKELLKRGIASTGAAYPVTTLTGIRARFCLSASHSDEMIEYTLQCLDEIGGKIGIKFDHREKTIEKARPRLFAAKPAQCLELSRLLPSLPSSSITVNA